MPSIYNAGSKVTVTVSAPMDGENVVATTGVEYAIFDQARETVLARGALSGYTNLDAEAQIEIPASLNQLSAGAVREMRRVEVYFIVATGDERLVSTTYVIQSVSSLVLMTNTFQTLDEAELTALELPALAGWAEATDQQKIGALTAAFDSMCRLSYRYLTEVDVQALDITTDLDRYGRPYYYVPSMRAAGTDGWADFSEDFQRALRRAQVVEADVMLAGDPVGDKRRQGIITETIGESKIFLNPKPALQLPVSRACLEQLTGFIYRSARIGRA
jgi:hypothetical protein